MEKKISAIDSLINSLSNMSTATGLILLAAWALAIGAWGFRLWMSKRRQKAADDLHAKLTAVFEEEVRQHREDRNQWYEMLFKLAEESKQTGIRVEEIIAQANTLHAQLLNAIQRCEKQDVCQTCNLNKS